MAISSCAKQHKDDNVPLLIWQHHLEIVIEQHQSCLITLILMGFFFFSKGNLVPAQNLDSHQCTHIGTQQ